MPPNRIQQLLATQQLSRSRHQLHQNREYLRLQHKVLAVAAEAAIGGIELAIAAAVERIVQSL